jgi:hypothetical protein
MTAIKACGLTLNGPHVSKDIFGVNLLMQPNIGSDPDESNALISHANS